MKEIKLSKVNETIYYDTCDNGLDVYLWVNERANEYYATLNVKYGSIDTKFKVKNNVYEKEQTLFFFLLSLLLFALCAGRAGTTRLLEGTSEGCSIW